MRPLVLDAINRAWKRGIKSTNSVEYAPELMQWHKKKGCDGGVWEVTMKDNCWMPKSEDKVAYVLSASCPQALEADEQIETHHPVSDDCVREVRV